MSKLRTESLNKRIAKYFEGFEYAVTGYPEKPVLGTYILKHSSGIVYEIGAYDVMNCVLNKQSLTTMESFLLISQDQEH
jgi:hypothetical protein